MRTKLIVSLVVLFALVSWVACGGGTGESTGTGTESQDASDIGSGEKSGTGPESQDASDSGSGEKSIDRIEGWKIITFRVGDDAFPVVELQVPENWPFIVAKDTFASLIDEDMAVEFVRTGRRALEGGEEAAKEIPKEKLSLLNISGLYGNVLTPDGKIQMKYRPLDHFEIKGRQYFEEDGVKGVPFSVDGIGATQYRRESTLEGGDKVVRLDTIISSDNPRMVCGSGNYPCINSVSYDHRTLCGAFGFHIYGFTRLGNEDILHKVIDTVRVSDPKKPIFESCDDPAGDYSAWADSFLPEADIYISDLKIKSCTRDDYYARVTANITNKGEKITYGAVMVRFISYTAGGKRASSDIGKMRVEYLPPGETIPADTIAECTPRPAFIEVIGVTTDSGKDLTFYPSGPALKPDN